MSDRQGEPIEIILCLDRSEVCVHRLIKTKCAIMALQKELAEIGFGTIKVTFTDSSSMRTVSRENI